MFLIVTVINYTGEIRVAVVVLRNVTCMSVIINNGGGLLRRLSISAGVSSVGVYPILLGIGRSILRGVISRRGRIRCTLSIGERRVVTRVCILTVILRSIENRSVLLWVLLRILPLCIVLSIFVESIVIGYVFHNVSFLYNMYNEIISISIANINR